MIEFKNKVFKGSVGRNSVFDCTIPDHPKALIIFIHGYKGYKDWGAWNLLQNRFVKDCFGFLKFNMSHNGGTVDQPIDFPDLDAFGENRYSFELNDLEIMITEAYRLIHQELELDIPIYLLGHSRGGGVAIIQAANDERITKVISLAGISTIGDRFPSGEELEDWKREGVRFVYNGRTQQQMPHFYSFYEDFLENQELLDIEKASQSLEIPFLQIHGDMDESVSITEGFQITEWTNTEVKVIKGADHTFGSKQPWESNELPEEMDDVVEACLLFFNK
ncbi:MAG: alpha/beta hydrolase [Crocinitomicaceae bacterium]|nr:alpha/beta hydrolase [Crocinitomicaceae bacterium]